MVMSTDVRIPLQSRSGPRDSQFQQRHQWPVRINSCPLFQQLNSIVKIVEHYNMLAKCFGVQDIACIVVQHIGVDIKFQPENERMLCVLL